MKQIDEFVNSIYADFSGKEAKEMKEEMRSHLLEAVEELKEEGYSEEEAASIALERFGDERQMTRGLLTMFKQQKTFAKWVFRVSLVFLVMGLIVSSALLLRDNKYDETFELMVKLAQEYNNQGEFTAEDKKELQTLIDREPKLFDNISFFSVIKKTDEPDKELMKGKSDVVHAYKYETLFVYGEKDSGDPQSGLMRQGAIDEENPRVVPEDYVWYVEWQYKEYGYKKYEPLYYVFFVVSAVLVVLWGVINIYHRTRIMLYEKIA
jgi:cytochrome c-type biogenesis protein CcmH/NrfF